MAFPTIADPAVSDYFERLEPASRARLLLARAGVMKAAGTSAPPIEESLKWGEPSYRTGNRGKAVRINMRGEDIVLLFHCRTSIVSDIRDRFGAALEYDGQRAVILRGPAAEDAELIGDLAAHAFNYRR